MKFLPRCRQGDYAKQQQTATRLNKLLPSSQHLWWVVLSILLQARASLRGEMSIGLEPAKLVQLAESMISRQTSKDGKLDSYEALLVYLDILLAQVDPG
jgi:N-terminal acetyltransferase B complex non-catalytic subunit